MAVDDDLPEFTGHDRTTLAVPKPAKSFAVTDTPPPAYDPKAGLHDDPAPRVTPYRAPEAGESHPKHAVLGPALRLDKAEQTLTKANAELVAATNDLRAAEIAQNEAEEAFVALHRGPTQEATLRAYADRELQLRKDRVRAGQNPSGRAPIQHGNSVLDAIAAHRPRSVAKGPSMSLRSRTVRR